MTKLERRVRNYVKAHKKALGITSLAVMIAFVQHRGIKSMNEFLVEKDLFEEYYGFEDPDALEEI